MPLPDLTEDEHVELVRLVRDAIARHPYSLSLRVNRLKSILAKLNPAPTYIRPKPDPSWWSQG